MSQVILYDIPSKEPKTCWSLNPWKPRLILNYKGIDYKTEWVEYPDLAPYFKSLGIPPNNPNDVGYFMDYSSPAIRYEDGSYGMDSWKIAHELEKRYPEPSLHLDDSIVIQVRDHIGKIMNPLIGYILPRVPTHILGPASAEYFETTREKMFGKPLAQVAQETATEQAWKDVEEPVRQIAEILKKNGGPFFLGKTVSYADFIFVGYLQFLKAADEKVFDRFVAFDPAFSAIYDASKPWLEKDN